MFTPRVGLRSRPVFLLGRRWWKFLHLFLLGDLLLIWGLTATAQTAWWWQIFRLQLRRPLCRLLKLDFWQPLTSLEFQWVWHLQFLDCFGPDSNRSTHPGCHQEAQSTSMMSPSPFFWNCKCSFRLWFGSFAVTFVDFAIIILVSFSSFCSSSFSYVSDLGCPFLPNMFEDLASIYSIFITLWVQIYRQDVCSPCLCSSSMVLKLWVRFSPMCFAWFDNSVVRFIAVQA